MFILSEKTSIKQIFEQTFSLITVKFGILRCQTKKGKKITYALQYFTDTTNCRNCKKYKKISKTTLILVAFSFDFFMKQGTYRFILLQKHA